MPKNTSINMIAADTRQFLHFLSDFCCIFVAFLLVCKPNEVKQQFTPARLVLRGGNLFLTQASFSAPSKVYLTTFSRKKEILGRIFQNLDLKFCVKFSARNMRHSVDMQRTTRYAQQSVAKG